MDSSSIFLFETSPSFSLASLFLLVHLQATITCTRTRWTTEPLKNMSLKIDSDIIEGPLGSQYVILSSQTVPKPISRLPPVTLIEWNSLPLTTLKRRIFRGGLNPEIRVYAWNYLLGFYEKDSHEHERIDIYSARKTRLQNYKVPALDTELYSKIKRDVIRTDASLEFYREHIENQASLQLILGVWVVNYSGSVGYVQGMNDLASVFLIVFRGDAVYAFYAFRRFMERLEVNFYKDGSGIQMRLDKTALVLQNVLPGLYNHLKEVDCLNLFCCYRWLGFVF